MKVKVVRTSDRWGMREPSEAPPLPGCVREGGVWVLAIQTAEQLLALSSWRTPLIVRPAHADASERVSELYDDYRES